MPPIAPIGVHVVDATNSSIHVSAAIGCKTNKTSIFAIFNENSAIPIA